MKGKPQLLLEAAQLVRAHMRATGQQQKDLAEQLGVTTGHVSRILLGKATAMNIDQWAKLVGIELRVEIVKDGDE